MIIDCISDLHGYFPELEGGDLLILAGGLTARDKVEERVQLGLWLKELNYKKIICISGNPDVWNSTYYGKLDPIPSIFFELYHSTKRKIEYLCDSGTEFEGLKIWGSPWTKTFEGMNPNCKAFICDTEEELAKKWALIPDDVDILVTHSPPYGILDKRKPNYSFPQMDIAGGIDLHVGSKSLALKIGNMENPPKLWVWGHIHECYGEDKAIRGKPCKMINASVVNERYQHTNKPVRVIL